jgi:hypothetical protein
MNGAFNLARVNLPYESRFKCCSRPAIADRRNRVKAMYLYQGLSGRAEYRLVNPSLMKTSGVTVCTYIRRYSTSRPGTFSP